MRRSVIFLLLFAPLISSLVSADTSLANPDSGGGGALQLSSSLLPPALGNNGALLVTLDGKVVSVNPKTMEIEWALSSGPRIHSSYQNVSYFNNCRSDDHFFVDIGEDWALYRHSNIDGKKKLSSSVREYVASTPVVSEDGGVTLGSKKTTVFAVNAVTGEVIRSFKLGDNISSDSLGVERGGAEGLETTGLVLYLERTDHTLQHCTAEGDLLWKLETAEFDAQFRYPRIGNGLGLEDRLIANSTVAYLKKNDSYARGARNMSYEFKYGESNGPAHGEINETQMLLTSSTEGRRIGKLLVSSKEIAKGSNGTIVLEGIYDGRPVAVKRLVRTHHDVALKEIQNLIASDQHPNFVRWYGVEHDQDFVYLSLERCSCSLNDLIYYHSESFQGHIINKDEDPHFLAEYHIQLQAIMGKNKNVELWKTNGYPSSQMLELMRDFVSGLAHLHEIGIIHRDLKPQNVLIIKGKLLRAKLSDMGISKRLQGDKYSITQHATGYGSSGWQAPEQLLHQRQTRAVDIFSLGCLIFFCLTGGKHPYGDSIERDVNIVNDRKDLFLVENIPEAVDLFTRLFDPNPDMRPTAVDVMHHPFFWNSETRLSFLRDASDRVELEDRETGSQLFSSLESNAAVSLNGKWDGKMEPAFLNNVGRYRRYKFDSIRDLLRVIRNKLNHYRELPQEIQELLGTVPEGFDNYFSSRFPKLLIEVYKVLYKYCKEEDFFRKYIKGNPV